MIVDGKECRLDQSTQKSLVLSSSFQYDVFTNSFLPVYFSAAKGFAGGLEKYKTKVVIRSNGTITWFAATQFTSSCKQNIRFFPYDEQFCYLKFG